MSEAVPNDFECPICMETYTERDRCPMTLVPCGHSVCKSCLGQISRCPKCMVIFRETAIAYTVMGALERYLEMKHINDARVDSKNLSKEARENIDLKKAMAELTAAQLGKAKNWKTLMVRGLPAEKNEQQFIHMWQGISDDLSEKVNVNIYHNIPRGQCLLTFECEETARKFLNAYNQQKFMNTENVMKIEFGEFKIQKEPGLSSLTQQNQAPVPTVDKKKVYISGLPPYVSPDDVYKWLFDMSQFLQNGVDGISLRSAGGKQNCIASFTNEAEPNRIISKLHNQLYPGSNDFKLSAFHHRPKQQNKTQEKTSTSSSNKTTNNVSNAQNEVELFVLGLPPKVTETDVAVMIFRNSPHLHTHSLSLKKAGNVQSCRAKVTDRNFANLVISEWNGKQYPGSGSFVKVDFFKPPTNRPRDPSRGRPISYSRSPEPNPQPPRLAPPSPTNPVQAHQFRPPIPPRPMPTMPLPPAPGQPNLRPTSQQSYLPNLLPAVQPLVRQSAQAQDPLPVLSPRLFNSSASELPRFAPSPSSPIPQQIHYVLVGGLPKETQIDDIVTTFHPICKMSLDLDLRPRVRMYDNVIDKRAIVGFQSEDAAVKIVHLFNNAPFGDGGKIIRVQLYNC